MYADRLRQILVIIFTIGQFVTGYIAGQVFGDVPREALYTEPIYFLPASYTFAVWGVILIFSVVYAIYQAWRGQSQRTIHRHVGWWVMLNTVGFSAWTWLALQAGTNTTEYTNQVASLVTVLVSIAMLFVNVVAFRATLILKDDLTSSDKQFVMLPIAVYFSWITIATIANFTSYFAAIGWAGNQFDSLIAIILLIIATGIGGVITINWDTASAKVAYTAVMMWAAIGIAVANLNQSLAVSGISLGVTLIMLSVVVYSVNHRNHHLQHNLI